MRTIFIWQLYRWTYYTLPKVCALSNYKFDSPETFTLGDVYNYLYFV